MATRPCNTCGADPARRQCPPPPPRPPQELLPEGLPGDGDGDGGPRRKPGLLQQVGGCPWGAAAGVQTPQDHVLLDVEMLRQPNSCLQGLPVACLLDGPSTR